jgi:1,4-alpha-glucan branching enzyme
MKASDQPEGGVISHLQPGKDKGKSDVRLVLYLPPDFGSQPQYRVAWSPWRDFSNPDGNFYRDWLHNLKPNTEIWCRYRDGKGHWRPIAPLGALENLNGRHFVAANDYRAREMPRRTENARICLESTLEGLLAGYEWGTHAPQELQDLLSDTIAGRMLRTGMPAHMGSLEIDEIMVPVFPSVADRSHLNPKFNYLIYAVGEVDWQVAQPREFQALVDAFYEHGISLVPDMIFAHFVRKAHPGGLDEVARDSDGKKLHVDGDAYYFRDYGTWMFDLANPELRGMLVAQIQDFILRYNLSVIRIDFVDGIVLQYSTRAENFGERFLRELAAALRGAAPQLTVIGEAFSTAGNPAVKELIKVSYCPRGFSIAEEIYKPPRALSRPFFPDVRRLANEINGWRDENAREAIYAQLHDEAWKDEHIAAGRPHVPWAYGAHPAQLALHCGEQLVELKQMSRRHLLDFVRRRVRGVEALTMLISNLRYVYLPAVDSLALGRLDEPQKWIVSWDEPSPADMQVWMNTRLPETEIFQLHDQHRLDMTALRAIYRTHTPIDEEEHRPLIRIAAFHVDEDSSILGIIRRHRDRPQEAMMALFNFGSNRFMGEMAYECPVPEDLTGRWKILFDGEVRAPENLRPGEVSHDLSVGTELVTGRGRLSGGERTLRITLGANSLTILQYA